jgi:large subunit ribosomal protein L54
MICHRCIHRFQALKSSPTPSVTTRHCRRNASALAPLRASTYTLSQGSTASRSISTTPAPSTPSTPHLQSSSSPTPVPVSSVRAGMPLKGLGYFKGKDPPVALEDHEYPDWLWGLLDKKGGAKKDGAVVGDTYCKPIFTNARWRMVLCCS